MEEARDAERAAAEANARAHTADYVEARGMLIPAVDYFSRATNVAERTESLTGELLSEVSNLSSRQYFTGTSRLTDGDSYVLQAAEANMSLGNVSYSHQNEQYFHRAIRYLRQASQISGFRLSPYLQRYKDLL